MEILNEETAYHCLKNVQIGERTRIFQFVNAYNCALGDDCKVGAFVEIQKGVNIGNRCKISSHSFLCEGVQIEDDVFDDEKPAPASRMYFVKRELIEFRRAVHPLVQPLDKLAAGSVPYINSDSALLFSDVRDHLLKVIDEVDALDALMDAALHANVALIQVQQNADMRKISAYVGIGAVPTMIAGIYGMNFDNMPELQWKYGYFIVVGFLGVVSLVLFRLFRRNRWL
jgi:Mg2+ and Co2+ transporter CorA